MTHQKVIRRMKRMTVNRARAAVQQRLARYFGLVMVASLPVVSGCDFLTRFEQERYECPPNPTGILELDFRAISIGSEATAIFADRTIIGRIIESADDQLSIQKDNMIIRVDRNSALVRLTSGGRYVNIRCNKTVFKM